MNFCSQSTITDAAFVHLRGIHTLYMGACHQAIIGATFEHLQGIHTLLMQACKNITPLNIAKLVGITVLDTELGGIPTQMAATQLLQSRECI